MERFARRFAIGVVFLASVAGFASSGQASPPATETGSGTIGLSHFHQDGTNRVELKSNDAWFVVQAAQDLAVVRGGPLGFTTLAVPSPTAWGFGTGTRAFHKSGFFEGTIFVPRQRWPFHACGVDADFTSVELEFVIEGSTKAVGIEPVTGTIRSTKNSDFQFKGTFVSRTGGFGFGSMLDYTVTVECFADPFVES